MSNEESPPYSYDMRILVVDDDESLRDIVHDSLNEIGFSDVTEASDGTIALEMIQEALAEKNPFELILSDIVMSEMGGLELLSHVRKKPETRELPFIILTAHGDTLEVIKAAQAKVNALITKPFALETLRTKIDQIFRRLHSRGDD